MAFPQPAGEDPSSGRVLGGPGRETETPRSQPSIEGAASKESLSAPQQPSGLPGAVRGICCGCCGGGGSYRKNADPDECEQGERSCHRSARSHLPGNTKPTNG